MVLGYLLGAFLPGESHIHTFTLITALIAMDAGLCLVGALRLPPQPSPESASVTNGLRALRAAFGNRRVRRLCGVVAIPMGTFIALATSVQPLLAPAGVPESTAGLILALTMIAGVVGCAVVPVWADRPGREVQVMGAAIAVTAGACLHLALVPSTPMAFLMLLGTGFVLLPALPLVLSLSERHAPEAESTAAGLIWMAGGPAPWPAPCADQMDRPEGLTRRRSEARTSPRTAGTVLRSGTDLARRRALGGAVREGEQSPRVDRGRWWRYAGAVVWQQHP